MYRQFLNHKNKNLAFIPESYNLVCIHKADDVLQNQYVAQIHAYRHIIKNGVHSAAYGMSTVRLSNQLLNRIRRTVESLNYQEVLDLASTYNIGWTAAYTLSPQQPAKIGRAVKKHPELQQDYDVGVLHSMLETPLEVPQNTDGWYRMNWQPSELETAIRNTWIRHIDPTMDPR